MLGKCKKAKLFILLRQYRHELFDETFQRELIGMYPAGVFGHAALRAAFDASPLFGAGRVEDTFNLIGHAVRDVLRTVAKRLEVDVETAAQRTEVPLVAGPSLKSALDIDWDDPAQKRVALNELLGQIRSLGAFLESELQEDLKQPPLSKQWDTVGQILSQDLEPDPDLGGMRIRRGVAPDRRISIADGEMRHGR